MAGPPPGYIFLVSGSTAAECLGKGIAGLPSGKRAAVANIKAGDLIFVYNTVSRMFHGVFEASCDGGFRLEPDAFGGGYPSQCRFREVLKCPDQPMSAMRGVLPLDKRGHFSHELDSQTALRVRHVFERAAGAPLTTYGAAAAPARAAPTTPTAPAAAAARHIPQPRTPATPAAEAPTANGSGAGSSRAAGRPAVPAARAPVAPVAPAAVQPLSTTAAAAPTQAAPGPAAAAAVPASAVVVTPHPPTSVPVEVVLPWLAEAYPSHGDPPAPAAAPAAANGASASASAASEFAFKECVICLELVSLGEMVAFVPCGHRCICQPCSQTKILPGAECPKCRQQTMFSIRIFDD